MAKLVKLVYVIIVFYTLFLVATEIVSGIPCNDDVDCPQTLCEQLIADFKYMIDFKSECVSRMCACTGSPV
ncbi:Nodule Cysteine-Rich (NCR) secreted peptide [Medicago truncatula]|uniref:Nodule Cysteine-Rich (NCR) secreted peptide n=2 Tax=Medicago truncatula TaxID=3880 RepID=G7IV70_MEDTR|nr:Nodule Cysteine-Rich (NCR) secreted peptide [Medicago truncatula]AES70821.1 Nodule Cysteine-Rich (NCR) secreted peptide [Medicago truncatula]KEH34528.1 Nodule Cysteine-Rich (NCR) secreted peptide [Medicago truncatula]